MEKRTGSRSPRSLFIIQRSTLRLSLGGSLGLSGSFALGVLGGGSGLSLGLGGSFCLGGSLTLGGDGGSLGLVGLLLGLETSLAGVAGVVLHVALLAVYLSLFGLQPLVETHIGGLLADGTLLDTNLEVCSHSLKRTSAVSWLMAPFSTPIWR